MNYPGGLKLNSELSNFLGQLFMWLTSMYEGSIMQYFFLTIVIISSIMHYIIPYSKPLLQCIFCCGSTFILCFLADLSRFLCLHLQWFNFVSSKFYNWASTLIKSLLRLFGGQFFEIQFLIQGKRYNVLRKRTDSVKYELDQLLVGTILFTCLVFLMPTVTVYYGMFKVVCNYDQQLIKVEWNYHKYILCAESRPTILEQTSTAQKQRYDNLIQNTHYSKTASK